MKRLFTILFVAIGVLCSLSAAFDYKLDLFSFDPLYDVYIADKDRPGLEVNYILQYKGFPDHVYQDGDGAVINPGYFPFVKEERPGGVKPNFAMAPFLGQIKLGETLSLFRNTFTFDSVFSPVSFDFTFQGNLNILMEGAMADMVGYDGVFSYGLTASMTDKFAFKVLAHHYCTHYGDSILKRIPLDLRDDFWVTYKYVRMNCVDIGISVKPTDWMKIYGEYIFAPSIIYSLRPIIFRSSYLKDLPGLNHPSDYRDQIIGLGIEFNYPIFPQLGKTTIGYDCHMYEHGKIIYKDDTKTGADRYLSKEQIHYDPDAPWTVEHGLVINQEINDYLSVDLGFHWNGAPLHLFYYLDKAAYAYVGVRFDPNPTYTIYDTAK